MSEPKPTVLEFNPIFLGELLAKFDGCPHCDYDEAEGGVINHCDACCRDIITRVFELFQAANARSILEGAKDSDVRTPDSELSKYEYEDVPERVARNRAMDPE